MSTHALTSRWLPIALINFLIAAIFGLTLRFAFVVELPWIKYTNVLHAHSHVAMLGWLHVGIYLLIIRFFLDNKSSLRAYHRILLGTQITVVGMAISFAIQGYSPLSIAFSTLHTFLCYWFLIILKRDLKRGASRNSDSEKLLYLGCFFMVLSTLAIYLIPVCIATGLRQSALYYASIQFYLHFQFNGWYIFVLLAVLFKILETRNIPLDARRVKYFITLLTISCLLTYALAVTWSTPVPMLFIINSTGVVLQLAAVILLIYVLYKALFNRHLFPKNINLYLGIAGISWVLKVAIQTAVIVPYLATVGYTLRNFVIGFLHLLLLGMATTAVLAFLNFERKNSFPNSLKVGMVVLITGIVLSEITLFIQGILLWTGHGFLPGYYGLIFSLSSLLPLGVAILIYWAYREHVRLNSLQV